ncbi:MAG: small-conductance mechanosensitive channel [Bacteroidia bacterium]|jgi:small-conductance mechanosensitive channel
MDLKEILEYSLFETGTFKLTVYRLLMVFTMFAVAKFALWSIKKEITQQSRFSKLDAGNKHALFIIVRYLIWVIVITIVLEMLGIKVTILIAGSAALLVGVGLGIQQTFNDIISRLILLI